MRGSAGMWGLRLISHRPACFEALASAGLTAAASPSELRPATRLLCVFSSIRMPAIESFTRNFRLLGCTDGDPHKIPIDSVRFSRLVRQTLQ